MHWILMLAASIAPAQDFHYEEAPTVEATAWGGPNAYDADLVSHDGRLGRTWLEYREGADVLLVQWDDEEPTEVATGRLARPTLTSCPDRVWLTWEQEHDEGWRLHAESSGVRLLVQSPGSSDMNHDACASGESLRLAWQTDVGGQFDIAVCDIDETGRHVTTRVTSTSASDWRPAVTPTHLAWDAHLDTNDVLITTLESNEGTVAFGPITSLASTAAFEGRIDLVDDAQGRTWYLYEEGGEHWGRRYVGNWTKWNNITDRYGPLHRFRALHVGVVGGEVPPFPMPLFEVAESREDQRPGAAWLGTYYERGRLAIDEQGTVWVAARHFFQPQVCSHDPVKHHVEQGWGILARHLAGDSWSEAVMLPERQRDGMQRLELEPHEGAVMAAWETGRTDRREDAQQRGVWVSTLGGGDREPLVERTPWERMPVREVEARPEPPTHAGMGLYYGDLHRHTDLSLCFPFYDGSIEDNYRYAIDVAHMDFLAITDHARDIDRGNVDSLLWWRTIKEVTRHRLSGRFMPYFSYERSQGATDHNVISLRDDMLRPHQPPLESFWAELDEDTFTIPHATIAPPHESFNPVTWTIHDDAKRPLMEIFQGFRDESSMHIAKRAMASGHHLGFIASSDHCSTSASFACVWAPERTRESIFRAMQSRRTFGATARVELAWRLGDHWMGSRMTTDETSLTFECHYRGTASIERVNLLMDGEIVSTHALNEGTFTMEHPGEGEHAFHVHIVQSDGNEAWASPIWVTVE